MASEVDVQKSRIKALLDPLVTVFSNPVVMIAVVALLTVLGIVVVVIVVLGIGRLVMHWFYTTIEEVLDATIGKIIPKKPNFRGVLAPEE